MKIVARCVALTLALSLSFTGPLATFAVAQQTSQPDLMQETLKPSTSEAESSPAYSVGAGIVNVFYVPGKVVTCGAGAIVGLTLLALTFGTGYKASVAFGREGCGGKWAVTGEDLRTSEWFGAGEIGK